jgi:hypothetical protein
MLFIWGKLCAMISIMSGLKLVQCTACFILLSPLCGDHVITRLVSKSKLKPFVNT